MFTSKTVVHAPVFTRIRDVQLHPATIAVLVSSRCALVLGVSHECVIQCHKPAIVGIWCDGISWHGVRQQKTRCTYEIRGF